MAVRKRFITAATLLLGGSAALIIATAGLQWMKAYLNRECIFMEVRLAEREPRVGLEPYLPRRFKPQPC